MKMKKCLVVVLTFVMLLSLTACGGSGKSNDGGSVPSVVGDWGASVDFGTLLKESLGDEFEDLELAEGEQMLNIDMSFHEDGTYAISIDPEQMKSIMREVAKPLVAIMLEGMESAGDFIDIEGIVDQVVSAMEDKFDENELNVEGTYKQNGSVLTLDGTIAAKGLTYTGDQLIVNGDELGELVFTRK